MLTGFPQVHVPTGPDCRSFLAAGAWGQSMNWGGLSCGRTGVKKVSSPFLGNLINPRRKTKILISAVPPTKQLRQLPLQWKPQTISLSHTLEDSNLVSVLLCVFAIVLLKYYTDTTQLAHWKCTGNGFQSIRSCITIATTILEHLHHSKKKAHPEQSLSISPALPVLGNS